MLDKIRGKKDDENSKAPDLRGNNKKDPDIGERLKGMVGRASGKKNIDEEDKKELPKRKMPRPIPKPVAKPGQTPRLKPPNRPPDDKKPDKRGGLGGFGKRIPDDDQRTLVGAAVFAIILIVLVGAGYYFLIYAPYQDALGNAKQSKLNEVNSYFTGPLATDPRGIDARIKIEGAETPEQAMAVDVLGPATQAWREYQNQQIESQKDPYGRVMISYNATGQKNVIIKVADAQRLVNEADASVLSKMQIKVPDTLAVPIMIQRVQAAGGLINVGNSVDVYLVNKNQTNDTNATTTTTYNNTPNISGATVLAILRWKDTNDAAINANKTHAQTIAINNLIQANSRSELANQNVEELLKATAARNWDETEVSNFLNTYGWRLSDFERTSNFGDLDPNVRYLILLEVPRENAIWLIKNGDSVTLTIPTQQAPEWMIGELKAIYR